MSQVTYTTGGAGKLLGVHANAVLKWCKQGKIDAYTTSSPGGHWRITRTALIEYAHKNGIPLQKENSEE